MTIAIQTWTNKRQTTFPDWVHDHIVDGPEANGSFLVEAKLGRMRVHVGSTVILRGEDVHVCFESEVKAMLDELDAADAPPPSAAPGGGQVGGHPQPSEVDIADRRDDTDDISARIRGHSGISEITEKPPVPTPPVLGTSPVQPRQTAASEKPVAALAKVNPAKGSMPTIEWIQLDRLSVDDSYQRSVDTGPSRSLITRIGRDWDWRLCVPLMVSRRDDGLYVIDGQHRLFGARLRKDIPQLPCCISRYDSPADEAAMFTAANRERRAMNRLDDFHAAQAGGDEEALAVAKLITEAGFTVSRKTGSASWAPGEVAFTSAIAKVRRKHGDPVVRDALKLMADAFPDERLVAGSSIFTAITRVLITPPPQLDRERLFRALLTYDMPGWASFLAGSKGGDDRAAKLRELLLMAYEDVKPEAVS